jgi:xylulokinase
MLECQDTKIKTSDPIRFVGGGALSDVTCQILADITGRTIETVASPQNVGAVGAAAVMGVALGIIGSIEEIGDFIPAVKTFTPDKAKRNAYDKNFTVFKKLYRFNKSNYKALNA